MSDCFLYEVECRQSIEIIRLVAECGLLPQSNSLSGKVLKIAINSTPGKGVKNADSRAHFYFDRVAGFPARFSPA
jgi:hypothetical protein